MGRACDCCGDEVECAGITDCQDCIGANCLKNDDNFELNFDDYVGVIFLAYNLDDDTKNECDGDCPEFTENTFDIHIGPRVNAAVEGLVYIFEGVSDNSTIVNKAKDELKYSTRIGTTAPFRDSNSCSDFDPVCCCVGPYYFDMDDPDNEYFQEIQCEGSRTSICMEKEFQDEIFPPEEYDRSGGIEEVEYPRAGYIKECGVSYSQCKARGGQFIYSEEEGGCDLIEPPLPPQTPKTLFTKYFYEPVDFPNTFKCEEDNTFLELIDEYYVERDPSTNCLKRARFLSKDDDIYRFIPDLVEIYKAREEVNWDALTCGVLEELGFDNLYSFDIGECVISRNVAANSPYLRIWTTKFSGVECGGFSYEGELGTQFGANIFLDVSGFGCQKDDDLSGSFFETDIINPLFRWNVQNTASVVIAENRALAAARLNQGHSQLRQIISTYASCEPKAFIENNTTYDEEPGCANYGGALYTYWDSAQYINPDPRCDTRYIERIDVGNARYYVVHWSDGEVETVRDGRGAVGVGRNVLEDIKDAFGRVPGLPPKAIIVVDEEGEEPIEHIFIEGVDISGTYATYLGDQLFVNVDTCCLSSCYGMSCGGNFNLKPVTYNAIGFFGCGEELENLLKVRANLQPTFDPSIDPQVPETSRTKVSATIVATSEAAVSKLRSVAAAQKLNSSNRWCQSVCNYVSNYVGYADNSFSADEEILNAIDYKDEDGNNPNVIIFDKEILKNSFRETCDLSESSLVTTLYLGNGETRPVEGQFVKQFFEGLLLWINSNTNFYGKKVIFNWTIKDQQLQLPQIGRSFYYPAYPLSIAGSFFLSRTGRGISRNPKEFYGQSEDVTSSEQLSQLRNDLRNQMIGRHIFTTCPVSPCCANNTKNVSEIRVEFDVVGNGDLVATCRQVFETLIHNYGSYQIPWVPIVFEYGRSSSLGRPVRFLDDVLDAETVSNFSMFSYNKNNGEVATLETDICFVCNTERYYTNDGIEDSRVCTTEYAYTSSNDVVGVGEWFFDFRSQFFIRNPGPAVNYFGIESSAEILRGISWLQQYDTPPFYRTAIPELDIPLCTLRTYYDGILRATFNSRSTIEVCGGECGGNADNYPNAITSLVGSRVYCPPSFDPFGADPEVFSSCTASYLAMGNVIKFNRIEESDPEIILHLLGDNNMFSSRANVPETLGVYLVGDFILTERGIGSVVYRDGDLPEEITSIPFFGDNYLLFMMNLFKFSESTIFENEFGADPLYWYRLFELFRDRVSILDPTDPSLNNSNISHIYLGSILSVPEIYLALNPKGSNIRRGDEWLLFASSVALKRFTGYKSEGSLSSIFEKYPPGYRFTFEDVSIRSFSGLQFDTIKDVNYGGVFLGEKISCQYRIEQIVFRLIGGNNNWGYPLDSFDTLTINQPEYKYDYGTGEYGPYSGPSYLNEQIALTLDQCFESKGVIRAPAPEPVTGDTPEGAVRVLVDNFISVNRIGAIVPQLISYRAEPTSRSTKTITAKYE